MPDNDKHSELVSVRLTNAQYKAAIKLAQADTRKLADWIRHLVQKAIDEK
jgi:hypothetical protein